MQSGAAKNKISSRSLFLSLPSIFVSLSLARPFSCPLPFHLLPFVSLSRFLFSPFARSASNASQKRNEDTRTQRALGSIVWTTTESVDHRRVINAPLYGITSLEDLFLLASSSTMSCLPLNPSLSLSLSSSLFVSRDAILSSDVQEKRRAAFPLHSLRRRRRRRRRSNLCQPTKATKPPYSPRRSWRSRVVR